MRPAQQARLARLEVLGLSVDSDLERDLGSARSGRAVQALSSGLGRLGLGNGKRVGQLVARADPELAEHLAQMPLHRARTEEQPRTDLRVRKPVAGQMGDLPLLRGQIIARLNRPLAHRLAGRPRLAAGALGERLHADRYELVVRGAELGPRVDPAMLASQPLAIEQVRAGELGA